MSRRKWNTVLVILFLLAFLSGKMESFLFHGENISPSNSFSPPRFSIRNKDSGSTAFIALDSNDEKFLSRIASFSKESEYKKELSSLYKHLQETSRFHTPHTYEKIIFLLHQYAALSPQGALSSLDELSPTWRSPLMGKIFQVWGEKNPESLAQYYLENRDSLYNDSAKNTLESAMSGWAKSDPKEAMKWLASLNTVEQRKGITAILEQACENNSFPIKGIVDLIPSSLWDDEPFMNSIMGIWALNDPGKAIEWKNSLTARQQEMLKGYENLDTSSSLSSTWEDMKKNPEALAAKIEQFPQSEQMKIWENFLLQLPYKLGVNEARQWRDSYLPRDKQEKLNWVYSGTYDYTKNMKSLEEDIRALPKGNSKTELLDIYLNNYSSEDYSYATDFLRSVNEAEWEIRAIKQWGYNYPQKATEWLDHSSSLPEERKNALRATLTQPVFVIHPHD